MLSSLVGEKEVFENKGNVFESDESPPNLFSMFDNRQQESKEPEKISEVKEDDAGEEKETPEIMEY